MLVGEERTADGNHDSRRRLPLDGCCSAHHEYAVPAEHQDFRDNVDRHWNVALLASLTALVTVVSVRNLGFFFVRFREDLAGDSREAAAWPLSVLEVFSHLGGFPVALLGQRLDVFQIAVAGSVLVWAGLGLSSFAGSIFWMSMTFGVVHGGGVGLVLVCLDRILMLYFDRYRGVANGLKCAGYSVSSLAFVHILSMLHKTWGFSRTQLIFALASTLTTVFCYVLQRQATEHGLCVRKQDTDRKVVCMLDCTSSSCIRSVPERSCGDILSLTATNSGERVLLYQSLDVNSDSNCSEGKDFPEEKVARRTSWSVHKHAEDSANVYYQKLHLLLKSYSSNASTRFFQDLAHLFRLFKDLTFSGLMVSSVTACFSLFIFAETIVDYALDKGASRAQAEWNIALYSASSLVGALAVPAIADRRYVRRWTLFTLGYFWLAASLLWLPCANSPLEYSVGVASTSVVVGAIMNLRIVLLADYLPDMLFTLSLGLSGAIFAPIALYCPRIIGYYRDNGGSYDNLYRALGVMQVCVGSALLGLLYFGKDGKAGKETNGLAAPLKMNHDTCTLTA